MKRKLFLLVLAAQTAWLLATVATQEYALAHGRTILLETKPVDPRDLLRGDYLVLNYKISDVPLHLFSPPVKKDLPEGTKIFAALAPDTNGFYVVTRASTTTFAAAPGEVVLQGKSNRRWWGTTNSVHVIYGIERYYVTENTGNPHGKLTAQVVVPPSGRAKLKQVFLDGKPYEEAMKP